MKTENIAVSVLKCQILFAVIQVIFFFVIFSDFWRFSPFGQAKKIQWVSPPYYHSKNKIKLRHEQVNESIFALLFILFNLFVSMELRSLYSSQGRGATELYIKFFLHSFKNSSILLVLKIVQSRILFLIQAESEVTFHLYVICVNSMFFFPHN